MGGCGGVGKGDGTGDGFVLYVLPGMAQKGEKQKPFQRFVCLPTVDEFRPMAVPVLIPASVHTFQ
jgi:hypothetical protein